MKQSSDKKTNIDPSKKGKPKQPRGGYNINLGYILLFTTLLLFYIFAKNIFDTFKLKIPVEYFTTLRLENIISLLGMLIGNNNLFSELPANSRNNSY